ncbi:hypothetical protein EVAR_46449_1 [Eumeta japonica]|uniref:Uncharacterized protein n=1 Tax=Eumeta variegata TaxID=151549 RepID=A0A4C1XHP0_EUMVA|nr:hypothetical protein EVAR_46449_1 [Eumeta japonica]
MNDLAISHTRLQSWSRSQFRPGSGSQFCSTSHIQSAPLLFTVPLEESKHDVDDDCIRAVLYTTCQIVEVAHAGRTDRRTAHVDSFRFSLFEVQNRIERAFIVHRTSHSRAGACSRAGPRREDTSLLINHLVRSLVLRAGAGAEGRRVRGGPRVRGTRNVRLLENDPEIPILYDCRGRKRMKASEPIYGGASTLAAGVTKSM